MRGKRDGGRVEVQRQKEMDRQVLLDTAVRAYLSTRCRVSSQHKLPTVSEIKGISSLGILLPNLTINQIEECLNRIQAKRYGPYVSDRQIDVL
jgi:hypothetical protein